MAIDPAPKYKSQARDYMATIGDSLRQFFQGFRQLVVMASRKFGLMETFTAMLEAQPLFRKVFGAI
jgi:hypothetical protein